MRSQFIITLVFFCLFTGVNAQKTDALWVHGDTLLYADGFYGHKGVPGKRNHPGRRSRAIYWTDDAGDLWLYGGAVGYQFGVSLGDLWKWDGTAWTWVAGDTTLNSLPSYGIKGQAAASNTPGPIQHATCAYHNGKLYLFGGLGIDKQGKKGFLNNLWMWDGAQWTWLSGDAEVYASGTLGAKGEASAAALPRAQYRSSSIVDSDGNFWLYGGYGQFSPESSGYIDELWKWDGSQWTWTSGSGNANQLAKYGNLNQTKPENSPGGRADTHIWYDQDGDLQVFAGELTSEVGGTQKLYADIWEWDGKDWTWISGDTTTVFARYNSLYTYDPTNRIGHRRDACYWQDTSGDVWVFGGVGWASISSGMLNDIWKWDGTHWHWMGGGTESGDYWHYGQKGVASEKNWPKARTDASFWMDKNQKFWIHGGTNTAQASGLYGDLWELSPRLAANPMITGNSIRIEDEDLQPSMADGTDFGLMTTTGVPRRQRYVVTNVGNLPLYLPNTWALELRNNEGSFRMVRTPQKNPLGLGDTLHFSIEFDPLEAKEYKCDVVFRSNSDNPEYLFRIRGRGTDNELVRAEDITCNSLQLHIEYQGVDHYTVLVADSGAIVELPFNGDNYNYSPNYLRAPFLRKSETRILYQGPDTAVSIKGLIANRSYQFMVVAGEGLPGSTVYFNDRAQLLYVRTLGSIWQDQLQLQPHQDSTICSYDSLLLQGSSLFPLEWMDGLEETKRWLQHPGAYYFLSIDSHNCILSSDTVSLAIDLAPIIPPLDPSRKPWCLGDTVVLRARPSHKSVWSNGVAGNNTSVTVSGTYTITSTTPFGCSTTESIDIQFESYPTGKLLEDTFSSVGDDLVLNYEADGDSVFFTFNQQVVQDPYQLIISDSGWLHLVVKNKEGCAVFDQAFVKRRDLVLQAIPNAFSPNGDGLNDVWWFLNEADSGKLTIFDRWGEVVHYGDTIWDGKVRGEVVPLGEYFFLFVPSDKNGGTIGGSIKVIR